MATGSMIIIGAGVAGLAAASYARMNGYETLLLEKHDRPGGVCASWQRGGYVFDYCLHHLAGTAPDSPLHRVWRALGALDDMPILNDESLVRIEAPDGQALELYGDLDRLQAHMQALAPNDGAAIRRYVGAARSLAKADVMAMGLHDLAGNLRLALRMPTIMRCGGIRLDQLAAQFSDSFLRRALARAQYGMDGAGIPVMANVMFLAGLQRGDLGRPWGGSGAMAQRMADRYRSLGGEIVYGATVREIIVESDRARGVRLADGTEHRADVIVSAADGYATVFKMLGGRYTNPLIDSFYQAYPEEQEFGLTIYLGVKRDLTAEPHHLTLLYDEPLEFAGRSHGALYVETMAHDAGMAPEGKSVVKAVATGVYAPWKELREQDPAAYRAAKRAIADAVAQRLDGRWPGLAASVEAWDVVTPVTVERYTGSFRGWQPWGVSKGAMKVMFQGLTRTLPGLEGFHHVGQWANAMIGLPNAAISGRAVVKDLCRQAGRRFEE